MEIWIIYLYTELVASSDEREECILCAGQNEFSPLQQESN